VKISPELDRIISAVAEAKMHLIIAVTCKAGSPERAKEIEGIKRSTTATRELLPLIGGFVQPVSAAISRRGPSLRWSLFGGGVRLDVRFSSWDPQSHRRFRWPKSCIANSGK
jgi:hypothetical protein